MSLFFLYSFKSNATRISRLLRDNPRTFVQQAADWIEYVHRHKGAKHLRPEVYNLHWYQYYLLDVLAFLLTALFAFYITMRMLFRLLWKIVTRHTKGKKSSKQEWKLFPKSTVKNLDKTFVWLTLSWHLKRSFTLTVRFSPNHPPPPPSPSPGQRKNIVHVFHVCIKLP